MHTKRIARGAAWLDKEQPGWFKDINVAYLDPYSSSNCVIGQVFGDFTKMMDRRYFLPEGEASHSKWVYLHPGVYFGLRFALTHGFERVRETDEQWLTAWTREIEQRRLDQASSDLHVPKEWAREWAAAHPRSAALIS